MEINKKKPIMNISINDINNRTDDLYLRDLKFLLKTNLTIPNHKPKKLLEQIYLYFNGTDTYELYIYINNEWKKTTLT